MHAFTRGSWLVWMLLVVGAPAWAMADEEAEDLLELPEQDAQLSPSADQPPKLDERLVTFNQRALSLDIRPPLATRSGEAEYVIRRGGADLPAEEEDALGLVGLQRRVQQNEPTWFTVARRVVPLVPVAVSATIGTGVWFLVGAAYAQNATNVVASKASNARAVVVESIVYWLLVLLPTVVVGLLLAAPAVAVLAPVAWLPLPSSAPGDHPVVAAVEVHNRALAEELGLSMDACPAWAFPSRGTHHRAVTPWGAAIWAAGLLVGGSTATMAIVAAVNGAIVGAIGTFCAVCFFCYCVPLLTIMAGP